MNRMIKRLFLFGTVMIGAAVGVAQEGPSGGLTLDTAIARALELNPALKAAASGVSAAESRTLQAGLWPNPEFDLDVENFGGDSDLHGFESAETTILISQALPLGGTPGRRRAVAESDQCFADRDLETMRLEVVARTTAAYYGVVVAQQRRTLANEFLRLTEAFRRHGRDPRGGWQGLTGGKYPSGDRGRAARIRELRVDRELAAARVLLAANWGSTTPTFDRGTGDLPRPLPPPAFQDLRSMLSESPEMRRVADGSSDSSGWSPSKNRCGFPSSRSASGRGVSRRRANRPGLPRWAFRCRSSIATRASAGPPSSTSNGSSVMAKVVRSLLRPSWRWLWNG